MSKTTFAEFKKDIDNLFDRYGEDFNKLKKQIEDEESEKKANKDRKDAKEKSGTNVTDNDTNEGFLKLGMELAEADKVLNTEEFKKLKDSVLEQLGGKSGASSLNKVIKIAKHPKLQEHRDRLPSGWGTLAIISTLKECEFDVFIADETLTAETSRLGITAKVNAAKGKEKTKSYSIRIDKNKAEDITGLSLDEIKNMLKGAGWELIIPKAK